MQLKIAEEVKIKREHPFQGRIGIVVAISKSPKVSVLLAATWLREERTIEVFADTLELLPIALRRREQG